MQRHICSHIEKPHLVNDSTLHVVGVISNPVRYHSRYRLFREWYERMKATPHVKVYIVELAFGDRHHEITCPDNPTHLQLRTNHELWHKENLINLGVRHLLPRNWRYVAWVDCDVEFHDKNWALETIHQLQHYAVVQPWATCLDKGFSGQGMKLFESFGYVHQQGVKKQTHPAQPYKYAHSGFAWACTRLFWENVGGLMDWCLVGSADHHMAWGIIGQMQYSVHGGMHENYKRKAKEWADHAFRVTHGTLGFVKTHIDHYFHGSKQKRYYRERWQIFIDHGYDPIRDTMYDEKGLIYITGKPRLEEEIRRYNRSRHEDSTEE